MGVREALTHTSVLRVFGSCCAGRAGPTGLRDPGDNRALAKQRLRRAQEVGCEGQQSCGAAHSPGQLDTQAGL